MKTEVLIIGGGLGGLTLAACLQNAGIECLVIDNEKPTPKQQKQSRTAALMNPALDVLKDIGLWDDLKPSCTALKTMRIIDDSHQKMAPTEIDFNAADIGYEQFGFNIPNHLLQAALKKRLKKKTCISPVKLWDYTAHDTGITARLDNDDVIKAQLIIGADGKNSSVRALAKIETQEHAYQQRAITCLIDHSRPHDFTSTEFHRSGGPFTLVPMPGNQSSIVWVEKTADAEKFMRLKKQDFEKMLQDRTKNIVGKVTLASDPQSWELKGLQAKRLTAQRCALIAEAAHAFSPIGAQGLNLSMRDIKKLTEILIDAASLGLDIGSKTILDKYETARRIDIHTRVFGVNSLNRIVSNNIGFLRGFRRIGFKTLDAIPPIKQALMQEALNSRV